MASRQKWRIVQTNPARLLHKIDAPRDVELGRRDLGGDFHCVSRKQAIVRYDEEGDLRLVSCGRAQTGYKSFTGGEWLWLNQGEMAFLNAGDKIALDRKLQEGSVLTLIRGSTSSASHGRRPAGKAHASSPAAASSAGPSTSSTLPPPLPPRRWQLRLAPARPLPVRKCAPE